MQVDSDFSDDEDLNYSPFSAMRVPPDLAFELDSDDEPKNPPIQLAHTRRLRERLPPDEATKVEAVLIYMDTLSLNLPIFLDLLSWGDQVCVQNMKINHERTALMVSEELPSILERWYKPPRSQGSTSVRAEGARPVLEREAFDCVARVVEEELDGVKDSMRCPAEDLSTEGLTSFQIEDLMLKLKRDTDKNPDLVEKSRSHHNSRFAKLLTTFLRSQGTPAKSIDLLRAFGLTMSHQWSVRALNKISENEMAKVREMVQTLLFVITHDNGNIPFRVFSQRLDNQSHFDSGTASTVFFQPNAPPEPPLCNRTLQEFHAQGRKTPLTVNELYDLSQRRVQFRLISTA
ncbi:hypothetical protein HYDPIDRAFT_189878 [Hydnomerulius pinastri MD-312]|uniref:Uncharacterized protein n=1 Tax=Hydnomerulius pinastri MD-312 TaxID=994086 RepID=A0A0C9WAY5_9AGAM|nr:hypothetical protein HYDPIDRAFT_189878 [Hydnomerulius pinastri MD-312]